jgi:hypothetical protein
MKQSKATVGVVYRYQDLSKENGSAIDGKFRELHVRRKFTSSRHIDERTD